LSKADSPLRPRRAARWRTGPHLRTLLLLGLVSLSMIGAVMLIWQTIGAERSQRAQAGRTNAVLMALHDLSRTAVNAETGQRGYFITLDRRYLAPYLVAREEYRPIIGRLRGLMGDDLAPRQRVLLDEIDHLSVARFAEIDETVAAIGDGGLLEARRRILTDEGQDVMERLRRAIGELETLELASFNRARDEATASEGRILPILVVLLGFIVATLTLGLLQVIRTADAEARAANASELAEARDRADLLARELNHRVKNLFAVVLAIVKMTGRDQPEAKPTVDRIAERIHALLTAHDVTQGNSAHRSARLSDLVEIALKPYRTPENHCRIEGGEVNLPERAVVPLGLVLHELTTNAVKYGAWAQPGGELAVAWRAKGGALRLDWLETHPLRETEDDAQARRGFGSTLIEGSARQLGGTIDRVFRPDGLTIRIEFPLAE
jgi:two-component sensor histidine kinase/CHASE3 domain sensor protein